MRRIMHGIIRLIRKNESAIVTTGKEVDLKRHYSSRCLKHYYYPTYKLFAYSIIKSGQIHTIVQICPLQATVLEIYRLDNGTTPLNP